MPPIIDRMLSSVKARGTLHALGRALLYPFTYYRWRKQRQIIFSGRSAEERFTAIYQNNFWGDRESVSGDGSTLENTANLRNELPKLLDARRVNTLFDAPCGDFHWMQHVLKARPTVYIGGDIVRPLVESLNNRHSNDSTSFVHIDLIQGDFPNADLMFCRDCLFHLSYNDTLAVLQNFLRSSIPYLLTTTHINTNGERRFVNRDIVTGEFRLIDLFAAPYHFPADVVARIPDWVPPNPEREMCLWGREQVQGAVTLLNRELAVLRA